jgi:hypothetical protein
MLQAMQGFPDCWCKDQHLQERFFHQEQEEAEEEEEQKNMILKSKTFCMFVSSIRIYIAHMQEEFSIYALDSSNCGRPSINGFSC